MTSTMLLIGRTPAASNRSASQLGEGPTVTSARASAYRLQPACSMVTGNTRASGGVAPRAVIDEPGEESVSSGAAAGPRGGEAPRAVIDEPGEESESSSAAARASGG